MRRTQRVILHGAALLLIALAVAVAPMFAADKKAPKDRPSREDLEKYDRNGNGRLDPDEEAARKADEAKEKRKKG